MAETASLENTDNAILLKIFDTAATIEAADKRLTAGLSSGEFLCMYYPARGQEMIPAGAVQALRPDDYMVTTYRCIHDVIAKGTPLKEIMAEMFGRVTGTSKGKGGPMHLSDPKSGMMVTTGIVGAGVPIANGLALGAKMQGTGQVAVVSFGDGSTSIGGVHEAFNMAAVWDLPVIFLLQNNLYGEHTAIDGYTKTERFADRAAGYGMKGVTCNGNDPIEVMGTVTEAVARARAGEGPTLIEAMTHRLKGHTFGYPTDYMDQDALKVAWENDPIVLYRQRLIDGGIASEDELAQIEASAKDAVEEAIQFALASDQPVLDELYVDVFNDEAQVIR